MAKNYTTKTASLRATKADIDILNVKQIKIQQGADIDGIVLPNDYYKFVGRTQLKKDEKYTLLDDDANQIYFTFKQTVKKLMDGSKLYLNNNTLETWSQTLDYLEIADNMFTNSTLVTFDTTLPMLRHGDYMFYNSDIDSFLTPTCDNLESAIGMFKLCPLRNQINLSVPLLSFATEMFAEAGTSDTGVTINLSLNSLNDCDNMFNGCHVNSITINSSLPINATKMFYGAKAISNSSKIDVSNLQFTNADNMFVKWDGKIVFPATLTNLTSANNAFSEIKPFGDVSETSQITMNTFAVSFPSTLTSANNIFEKSIIDNPAISFLDCNNLLYKTDMFKDCSLRTTGSIQITNAQQTLSSYYIYLPASSASMDYSNFLYGIDASRAAVVNFVAEAPDNCSINVSSLFENSKFNQFNFNQFNDDDLDDSIISLTMDCMLKGTNSETINIVIDDVISDTTTNVSAIAMFENATIKNLTFNANKLNNATRIFKNASINLINDMNIADVGIADEAFMNTGISSVGYFEQLGVGTQSLTSANSMYEKCKNISNVKPIVAPQISSANRMFAESSVPYLEIESSGLKNAVSMFENTPITHAFKGSETILDESVTIRVVNDLSGVSKLTNTFKGCSNLKHPMKGFETDDIIIPEKQTNISLTNGAINFANAIALESTFQGCSNLKFIDFTIPIAETIKNSFSGCTNLQRANFFAMKLKDATNAFQGCISLGDINLDEFFVTGETATLINGNGMFKNAKSGIITNNDTLNFTNLEIGNEMFKNCVTNNPFDSNTLTNKQIIMDKLVLGREMFCDSSFKPTNVLLPSLQDGNGMFKNTKITNFTWVGDNQFASLVSGLDMFAGCNLDDESVIAILTAIKSNTGLTDTKLSEKTYEPLISNSAKTYYTPIDVSKYNETDSIGVITIHCSNTNIANLCTSMLGNPIDEIISSSSNNAQVKILNENGIAWVVNLQTFTNN